MGIYDAYERYVSLNAVAREFQETLLKQRDQDFINTHSIEETTARLQQATAAASDFNKQAEQMHDKAIFDLNPVQGISDLLYAHDLAAEGVTKQQQANTLTAKQLSDEHEIAVARINANHASDAALQGQQEINAELAKSKQLKAEAAGYARQQDSLHQQGGERQGGNQAQQLADQTAEATAAAQTTELQRQEAQKAREVQSQIIQMQNEALNAGLQGNALYRAQQEQAIAAVIEKMKGKELTAQQGAAETAAISLKFQNQELQRLQAETDEVNKRARAEQEAGLTGIAKIQAQGQDRISDIDQKQARGGYLDQASAGSPSADADKDRQTAHDATLREMNDAEKQFNEQVQTFSDQTASKMVTGYAKVDQQRDASIDKLQDEFVKVFGQLDVLDRRYMDGQAALAQGVVAINGQADRERVELHTKAMSDIQATEVQAAKIAQSENKAATGEIVDEYNRRLAQAQATLHQQLAANQLSADDQAAVWQEYYARIKADADLAGAQMEKQAQEARDKVADSLSSLFSDPAGFLEKRAKDLMYKVLANGILSATDNLQGKGGEALANLLGLGPDLKAPTSGLDGAQHGGFGDMLGLGKHSGTAGGGSPLTAAGTSLTNAGTGLTNASTTLTNTGTVLTTAGAQLTSAAQAFQSVASALQSGGGPGSGSGGGFGIGDGIGDDGGDSGGGGDSGLAGASTGSLSAGFSAASIGSNAASLTPASGAEGATGVISKAAGGSSSALGAIAGAAGAGIAGGLGIASAYKNSNPLAGALSGGEAGAAVGSLLGPGGTVVGAAIGAIGGLLAGLFGDHGKAKAEAYDSGTVAPALASELANFDSGQTGYTQASRDLTNLLNQAQQATQAMGSGARSYFTNNITPEIAAVQAKIDAEEKAGRSKITFSAAQFHSGGPITGFGDLAIRGTEGYIHALMGEHVMNPQASVTHGPLLDAMNAGYSPMSVLSGPMRAAVASAAGGSTTRMGSGGSSAPSLALSLSALDGASTQRWLRTGGGKLIQQHLNSAAGFYGGKSDE